MCRYERNRRKWKVSFPKLVYELRAREVELDVEKQNIVRVRGQFLERFDGIVGRIKMLHVAPCRQDICQSRLGQGLTIHDQYAHGFHSPSISVPSGVNVLADRCRFEPEDFAEFLRIVMT